MRSNPSGDDERTPRWVYVFGSIAVLVVVVVVVVLIVHLSGGGMGAHGP